MNWKSFGGHWGKCEECWAYYVNGKQHINSLYCYKLGIPLSSLNADIQYIIKKAEEKGIPGKYIIPSPLLKTLMSGVIILYFNSFNEMISFYNEIKGVLREAGLRDRIFFSKLVRIEWLRGANYRRGCPEYDFKFGDWRTWRKLDVEERG